MLLQILNLQQINVIVKDPPSPKCQYDMQIPRSLHSRFSEGMNEHMNLTFGGNGRS